jgi:CHASE3 domain sensor protein
MAKRVIVMIICSILPLFLIAFIASRHNTELAQKNSRQLLITEVDEQVEGILLKLSQYQSAEQGFVLTGNEELLAPAIAAPGEIEKHLRRLSRLLKGDPVQFGRVSHLEPLVQERLNFIASVVIARKQRGFDAAVKLLSEGKPEQMTKDIKTLADEILAGEQTMTITAGTGESNEKLKNERLLLLVAFLGLFMVGSNLVFSRFA